MYYNYFTIYLYCVLQYTHIFHEKTKKDKRKLGFKFISGHTYMVLGIFVRKFYTIWQYYTKENWTPTRHYWISQNFYIFLMEDSVFYKTFRFFQWLETNSPTLAKGFYFLLNSVKNYVKFSVKFCWNMQDLTPLLIIYILLTKNIYKNEFWHVY